MNEQALTKIEPMPVTPSVEAMITLAIERGATVDTLERLMAVRREVRAEAAKEAFDRALALFQDECPVIHKNKTVKNRDGTVRYRYADLEQIKATIGPLIKQHGFSYRFTTKTTENRMVTICHVTHIFGHTESSEFEVPIEKSGRMNAVQESGSSSTYAKRYALSNGLGIITSDEDNDGQTSASEPKQPKSANVSPTSTAKRPGSARSEPGQHASKPAKEQPLATEDQRQRWIKVLQPLGQAALEYAYDHSWLLPPGNEFPGEPLETLELRHVPATKGAADAILREIQAGMDPQTPLGASGPPSTSQPINQSAQNRQPEANTPSQNDPGQDGDGIETIVGKLERVREKSGRSSKGPWTSYGLKIGSDWFNTFSTPLGECAKGDKGHTVRIQFRRGERGNDLVSIERAKKS